MIALSQQRPGQPVHMRRCRAGIGRAAVDVGDAARDLGGTLRGLLHVARDFLRRFLDAPTPDDT